MEKKQDDALMELLAFEKQFQKAKDSNYFVFYASKCQSSSKSLCLLLLDEQVGDVLMPNTGYFLTLKTKKIEEFFDFSKVIETMLFGIMVNNNIPITIVQNDGKETKLYLSTVSETFALEEFLKSKMPRKNANLLMNQMLIKAYPDNLESNKNEKEDKPNTES